MNVSPSDIEFMLHCYTQGFEPHERYDAPAIQGAISKFLILGMITEYIDEVEAKRKEHCYRTTEKGAAWIKMLCNTPWPIQRWVDGRDGSTID